MSSVEKGKQFYIDALSRNPMDFRAYIGLYMIHWELQPLLAAVYLSRAQSLAPQDHLETVSDSLLGHLKLLSFFPDAIRDVDLQARKCASIVVDVARGSRVSVKHVAEALPGGCVDQDQERVSWDCLCVVLLVEAHKRTTDDPNRQGVIEDVIKLLVGRALSLDLPVTLVAALDCEPAWSGIRKYKAVSSSPDIVGQRMEIDHIVGKVGSVRPRVNDADDIARARLASWMSSAKSRMLPVVIVDAANVAFRAWESVGESGQNVSSVARWALKDVMNFYASKGHEVKIVVSEKHLKRGRKRWQNRATEIWLDEAVEEIPKSRLVLIPPQNHDDSYMIALALRFGGIVVTNDMFRDWIRTRTDRATAERWARSHLVAFTFVGTIFQPNPDFIMPDDRDSPEW